MIVKVIAAVSQNGVLGDANSNTIPWNYPADFKFFKEMTSGDTVIFGRKTFESIGKPLPKRTNIVITRQENIQGVKCYSSLENWYRYYSLVLEDCATTKWICGGANIYREAMQLKPVNNMPLVEEIYLTMIPETIKVENPIYFPWINPIDFKPVDVFNITDSNLHVVKYRRTIG